MGYRSFNRVIVRITGAGDLYKKETKNNDFDEFQGYDVDVGCQYTFEIENHTSHRVKLETFAVKTDHPDLQGSVYDKSELLHPMSNVDAKTLKPGEKVVPSTTLGGITKSIKLLPNLPSDEEKNKMIEKFGCDAQAGTLYLDIHPMHPIIATFANSTGIKDAANEYIIGEPYGDYPLQVPVGGM
jgi:hypothetical protein